MTDALDWNTKVIEEFRANEHRPGSGTTSKVHPFCSCTTPGPRPAPNGSTP